MARPKRTPRSSPRTSAAPSPWVFVREFIRSPRDMGTLFPCSPAVAKAMLRGLETSGWRAVAELGPGNGVLTPTLVAGLPASCRFIALEISQVLAAEFRERLPALELVEADAANLADVCRARGIDHLDAVFSALPLRLLSPIALGEVLAAAAATLRPGGIFAQVTYWPSALAPGRQLRNQVVAHVGPIESDRLVAGNAPPAWVFRCVKQQTGA